MQKPTRVYLIDDHPRFRESVRYALGITPKIEVMGEAASGEEALEQLSRLPALPQVCLTDIYLNGMNGVILTRKLKERYPAMRVLAITLFKDPEMERLVREAGAERLLGKGISPKALRACLLGQDPHGSSITRILTSVVLSALVMLPWPAGLLTNLFNSGMPFP